MVFGSALFGNKRLRELIARYVDDGMLAAVAAAHANGRRLFIVTTNLDSQRVAIWDMGRIASSGSPEALASSAMFWLHPRASRDVSARAHRAARNGKRFGEMPRRRKRDGTRVHVAGRVLARRRVAAQGPRVKVYVLMNNKVDPDFQVVPNRAAEIGGRAASTSVKAQTRSLLFETYAAARRNGLSST